MTTNFTNSPHCSSRAHCRACRIDLKWRTAWLAPDACPHGFTPDNLPPRQLFPGTSTDHERNGIAGCCDGGNEKPGSR